MSRPTFWRSIENVTIPVANGGVERWAVAQGAAFRRMHVTGDLEYTNGNCKFASGGFTSDSKIDGQVNECSQQQWYSRNSFYNSFVGYVWNYVFSGVQFAPGNTPPNVFPNVTELATTPVSREKPFLYIDGSGGYNVFVPALKTNSAGITWSGGGLGAGTTLPISSFFIAQPSNTAQQINAALAQGKNLILAPGIYPLTAPINLTRANTVVLGLGYPTLVPQSGNAAMTIADVDGVEVAAVLIDAGPTNSPVLLQVGTPGATTRHAANPTTIFDTFFRIGGATAGSATTSLEVDSNDVILDNIWAWRADHGAGVGWTANTADHGLVVNGGNVMALGLAVEHYQKSQVVWNGNAGKTIFYQSEEPYDVPSQSAWMDGTSKGYPSYEVTSGVCQHAAYGLGVYSYFDQNVDIHEANAIVVPNVTGVHLTDMVTVKLNGSGTIDNVVDNTGGPAPDGAGPNDLVSYNGNGACGTTPPGTGLAIDAGGGAAAPFVADEDYSGGGTLTTQHAIDTTGVTNPAPQAVYQSNREGTFSYAIPGFTAGSTHAVRLHFVEQYFSNPGSREFNVSINGTQVLTNFDVIRAAGARYKATVQTFSGVADASGRIVISFTRGAVDQAEVSGIEVQ